MIEQNKESQSNTMLLNKNYEIAGNHLPRQLGHWLRMKTAIMGNYDTGPGLKNLIILWILHKVGRPLFTVRIWLNNQYALKHRLKKLLGR